MKTWSNIRFLYSRLSQRLQNYSKMQKFDDRLKFLEKKLKTKRRMSWETQCCVPNCKRSIIVHGEWQDGFVHTQSPAIIPKNQIDEGWFFQRGCCIAYHTHRVFTENNFYCPEHSPMQIAYVNAVKQWDKEQSKIRKFSWNILKMFWNGPIDDPPKNPFIDFIDEEQETC